VQSDAQQYVDEPLFAPWSQSSPASTVPSPQLPAEDELEAGAEEEEAATDEEEAATDEEEAATEEDELTAADEEEACEELDGAGASDDATYPNSTR